MYPQRVIVAGLEKQFLFIEIAFIFDSGLFFLSPFSFFSSSNLPVELVVSGIEKKVNKKRFFSVLLFDLCRQRGLLELQQHTQNIF
uniref:hypothetical protein n=1 Tax=Citrobacter freundii TaxID=546 RepID=UPI00155DBFC7|nr:hypothetical protein [Citrobacter freundii]